MVVSRERPNIVVIVSDDHGREATGCYGNRVVKTPNIDGLAADGVVFDYGFCTTASCGASRSVILTGLHNHTNRTFGLVHDHHHFSMAAGTKTLPELLNGAGYRTGRIGKKHYRPESMFPFQWDPPDETEEELKRQRDDLHMADRCKAFIDDDDGRPFFLYYCSHNPHRENLRQDHPLKPDDFGNPPAPFPGDEEVTFDADEVIVPRYLVDTAGTRAEIAEYYQSINRLDRGIGRLMGHLHDAGVMDNTVIFYLSDNGGAFPVAKTTLYEAGIRLPLIIRSPLHGVRGTASQALVNWADITPTVMDLAGSPIEATEQMLGRSMVPLLAEPNPVDWRDEVFLAHSFHEITNYYPMRVIRTRRHKFFYNIAWKLDFPTAADLYRSAAWQSALAAGDAIGERSFDQYLHRPKFELYDLDADPMELNNIAGQPEQAALVDSFIARVKDYQRRTDDPWLHKWTYE